MKIYFNPTQMKSSHLFYYSLTIDVYSGHLFHREYNYVLVIYPITKPEGWQVLHRHFVLPGKHPE